MLLTVFTDLISHIIALKIEEMTKKQKPENKNLENVIALCGKMLEMANLGDQFSQDDGCSVIFGTIRDSAYKISKLAKNELSRHENSRKP